MPTGNPFLDAIRGGGVRLASPSGSIMGFVDRLSGVPTTEEFIAGRLVEEERQRREEAIKAEAITAREQQELQALAGVYSDNLKSNNGDPKAAILAVLSDPRFIAGSASTVGEMKKRLQIIQDMAIPKPVDPVTLSEGGMLVDPRTGTTIASNPKPMQGRVLPEGGMLVDPQSGEPLGPGNPRQFEPQPTQLATQQREFSKEFAKQASQHVGDLLEEGTDAQLDQVALDRLNDLGDAAGTGAMAVVRSHLNRFGFAVDERTPPLQAYEALLNRLTPQQRQGLPGAASDRDVAIFRGALPQLWNTPEGRETIVQTLSALNRYKIERAQVADEFLDGRLTYRAFYQKLRNVKDPFAKFRSQQRDGGTSTSPVRGAQQALQEPRIVGGVRIWNPQTRRLEPFQTEVFDARKAADRARERRVQGAR